ncbi:MAG: aminotransferase class III-fold pyridoxal phosphate-dependent enzyme [Silicimonas sp.]|nr:aminotransferase class III-fold pyridoxal phosphate-dependent enzyme [Silicimonas sp.]
MNERPNLPNDLDAFWMPFTSSRAFKANPRLIVGAEGCHYIAADGRRMIDGTGGLWCSNAGHGHPKITAAIQKQAATMDFAHSFGQSHPLAFEVTSRLVALAPGFDQVFLTNSGSEAVDTALKIALAYHTARGEAGRRILVGRERAYHGINFGGVSVGGLVANKQQFGTLYPDSQHMRQTQLPENAFSRGLPEHGAYLAEDLQRLVDLYGAQRIAAVIVEPVAGAGGVLPPPKGYLERLREICDETGILLIFDEVITGFGRLGTAFGHQKLGVTPDLFTVAKGITNATVPMGGVFARPGIRDAMMTGPEWMPDLFHGYTYSGHPLACAASLATLDVYRDEGIFEQAAKAALLWEDMLHSLKGLPGVVDIRNCGLMGAVQMEVSATVGERGREVYDKLWDRGLIVRPIGDNLAMSPPLVITETLMAEIADHFTSVLKR